MPAGWRPQSDRISQLIAEEEARIEVLNQKKIMASLPIETTMPQPATPLWQPDMTQQPSFMPQEQAPVSWSPEGNLPMESPIPTIPQTPMVATPIPQKPITTTPTSPVSTPETVPFWQRALQVFAAPFDWVQENVINPAESVLGTMVGFVPEVERKTGEDYFEWKKRSWAGWKSPGIDINVPWSDEPWRVDVKGIMEIAPWLLIPGAGQVGGGVRAGVGVAGILGKLGTAGRVLGYAVEYSPWGLAEKTAGVAIKKGLGLAMKGAGKVSPAIEAKIFGKIVEEPVSPTVKEFTTFFTETVSPAYKAFKEAEPALRARQVNAIEEIRKRYRLGEIDELEKVALEEKATAGGIKASFAVKVTKESKAIPTEGKIIPKITPEEIVTEEIQALAKEKGYIIEPITKPIKGVAEWEKFRLRKGTETIDVMNLEEAKWALNTPEGFGDESVAIMKGLRDYGHPWVGYKLLADINKPARDLGFNVKTNKTWTELQDAGIVKIVKLSESEMKEVNAVVPVFRVDAGKSFEGVPIFRPPAIPNKIIPKTGMSTPIFTPEKVKELLNQIEKSVEKGFVERDTSIALRDMLMIGTLPEKHNIRDFAKVFGEEFAQSVSKLKGVSPSKFEQMVDLLNLPRAVLASGDLSGTFRQGLILVLTRPQDLPRSFGRQLKAFASEKLSLEMDKVLRSHPLYQTAVNDGVEFTALKKGARMVSKEEPFASNLAQMLPMVRPSERAFTTFLNEMRMSSYEAAYNAMTAQGASKAEMKLMGSFINIASGRGTLPVNLDKYAPALNTLLFSAKYQMSTLQLPRQLGRMLLSKNPYMRKEAARALVTFVGGGTALLGLLKATGRAKVEFDPRSSDFGKIVIGDTRLDIWRGYVQYARFAAQMLTGESKSAYGNMNKVERDQVAWRFLQGKSAPAFGLLVDLLKGETYQGDDILTSTKDVVRAARERLLPLALQDVMDAMEQNGVNGLWTAAPAVLGVGTLTYVNDLVKIKEKIAKEMGYETWDEIDPKTQRELENASNELQIAYIEFDRKVMGTAWGDWRLAGKAVDDVFKDNVNDAVAQYRTTGDGVTFRDKIGDAFTARRGGYDARDRMPQFADIVNRLKVQDTAEALVSLGPEQLAIKTYNDALYSDDMYDQYGDYRFDEATIRKEQLRQSMGDEMFNYVEEYQGMKYEDLPPEFQELARAKVVMRPYWDVQDRVVKLFGQGYADSPRGQSLISKLRKQKRLSDPEINKYYMMFYATS